MNNDSVIQQIHYSLQLFDEQSEKVAKEEYIKKLLLSDVVNKIKQNVSKYDFIDFKIPQQQLAQNKKSTTELKFLDQQIKQDFLSNNENFVLDSIYSEGLDEYAWAVCYKGYGKKIEIVIPIMNRLTSSNVKQTKFGQFQVSEQSSEHSWNRLFTSYRIEEVADFIRNYVKELTTL